MGPLPLSLWQIRVLLCQSVTHFPIWCLVTVGFIFIQLRITGRAYAASPGAIMWNAARGEELDAPQPRSEQTRSLIETPELARPLGVRGEDEVQRGQPQSRVRGVDEAPSQQWANLLTCGSIIWQRESEQQQMDTVGEPLHRWKKCIVSKTQFNVNWKSQSQKNVSLKPNKCSALDWNWS